MKRLFQWHTTAVPNDDSIPSARRTELLERAYRYVLDNGLSALSLRPLAQAVGSSPRVLLYLFGSKDGLVRALLARARADQMALLEEVRAQPDDADAGPAVLGGRLWTWLSAEERRPLLALWAEGYARSLVEQGGPWAEFGRSTVRDWLDALNLALPAAQRDTPAARAACTLTLAVLRGALLDLLATGDLDRTTAAVRGYLDSMDGAGTSRSKR